MIASLLHLTLGLFIAEPFDSEMVESLKSSVVNISVSSQIGIEQEGVGSWTGTGFIVDCENRLVATNKHVVSYSPAFVKVEFYSGQAPDGKLVYSDPIHDFSFIQVKEEKMPEDCKSVTFGSSYSLEPSAPVLLIGSNDSQAFSVKFGILTNPYLDRGDRNSATLQTSFDRAGGSSGAPVFDESGNVIGIHFRGTETTSFELRGEYLQEALMHLKSGRVPPRGELGIVLNLAKLSAVRGFYKVPSEVVRELVTQQEKNSTFPIRNLLIVDGIVPRILDSQPFQIGDLIWSIDGRIVGNDLLLFESILNKKVGQSIPVVVYRMGSRIEFEVRVADLNATTPKRILMAAGAVFTEVSGEFRRKYNFEGNGIVMCSVDEGSPLECGQALKGSLKSRTVVISKFDGVRIANLDDLKKALSDVGDEASIWLEMRDFSDLNTGPTSYGADIDFKFGPIRDFIWNSEKLDWVESQSLSDPTN